MDRGADIDRGICFPNELHQGHGKILPADGFRRGADVKAVGQYHINNETERHAREHHQAELVIAGGVVPPQQGRDRRQQHEPTAIRKNEPLVEGDEVIHRGVDDVFGGRDGQIQPEEPDEVDHPVSLIPQVRLEPRAQRLCVHILFSYKITRRIANILAQNRRLRKYYL